MAASDGKQFVLGIRRASGDKPELRNLIHTPIHLVYNAHLKTKYYKTM